MLLLFRVRRVAFFRHRGYHYRRVATGALPSVAPVSGKDLYLSSVQPAYLLHRLVNRMPVVFITERAGSYDDAVPESDDGYFVAKLIPHMVLPLADAEHVGLVDGVDLVSVILLAVDEFEADVQSLFPPAVFGEASPYLSQQFARNGAHPSVCALHFLRAVASPEEPLVKFQLLDLPHKGLVQLDPLVLGHCIARLDDLCSAAWSP